MVKASLLGSLKSKVPQIFKQDSLLVYLKDYKIEPKQSQLDNIETILNQVRDFGKKKRTWLKAMNTIIDLRVLLHSETESE